MLPPSQRELRRIPLKATQLGSEDMVELTIEIDKTFVPALLPASSNKDPRELGIRVALGAQRREVLQAALGRAFKLLAAGSAAGLLLGIVASRVLAFIVYQATPRDPLVLASVIVSMALLGVIATWIPARRALSVNPVRLLREE